MDKVYAVLLADGWHQVADNSFELDAYEFLQEPSRPGKDLEVRFSGGSDTGVPSAAFMFTEQLPATAERSGSRTTLKGPITSILAVREKA